MPLVTRHLYRCPQSYYLLLVHTVLWHIVHQSVTVPCSNSELTFALSKWDGDTFQSLRIMTFFGTPARTPKLCNGLMLPTDQVYV